MKTKQQLRDSVLAECALLTSADRQLAAKQLCVTLANLIANSSKIALYHAHHHEISLEYIVDYCRNLPSKSLYQPVASKSNRYLYFTDYTNQSEIFISDDKYLHGERYLQWYNLDLIILPLVAVDGSGARLGRGGGYYDFTLKECMHIPKRPILCGVGYQLQLLDNEQIPDKEWDIKLDYFASPVQLLKF